MKYYLLLFLIPLSIFAKVHYAKVEPYESAVLKSAVSGQILEAKLDLEGKSIKDKRVIHIDDRLDKINLSDTKQSIILLRDMLVLNKDIASSLKNSMRRKQSYYERISKLSTASKTQKDNAYNAYSEQKRQYLLVKEKIISLQKQILDMEFKAAQLQDTIDKKSIVLKDKYLYKLLVTKGDFVAPGTPLAKVKDARHAKLVLFLEPEELEGLSDKIIYFNGAKTPYKIDKIWRVSDEKYISSYRVEIYIPAPKDIFSRLVKIEIK